MILTVSCGRQSTTKPSGVLRFDNIRVSKFEKDTDHIKAATSDVDKLWSMLSGYWGYINTSIEPKTICDFDISIFFGYDNDQKPLSFIIWGYEGDQKYALRGEMRSLVAYYGDPEKNEYAGGDYAVDAAFNAAPPTFLNFARELWEKSK